MEWGGCEISFCACRRGMDRVCLGGVVKISFMNMYLYLSNSKRLNSYVSFKYSVTLLQNMEAFRTLF